MRGPHKVSAPAGEPDAARPHVRPSLDEALGLRLEAMAMMRRVVDGLTDKQLDSRSEPLVGPRWPDEGGTFPSASVYRSSSTRSGGTASTPSATRPSSRNETHLVELVFAGRAIELRRA